MLTEELSDVNTLQREEIEALTAIYGSDINLQNYAGTVFSINLNSDADKSKVVILQVTFTPGYPLIEPPLYELSAPWLKRHQRTQLSSIIESTYADHLGENVVFIWIDKIKDFLNNEEFASPENLSPTENSNSLNVLDSGESMDSKIETTNLTIKHGQPITDRKSTFQAHLAKVASAQEVKDVMLKLLENRKISSATHNISAFRIGDDPKKVSIQDCEDDGETHAGSRLLHLMQILEVSNVVVIVSRWYGGIQLGADRFKHINNVARDLLKEHGYLKEQKSKEQTKGKNKKTK